MIFSLSIQLKTLKSLIISTAKVRSLLPLVTLTLSSRVKMLLIYSEGQTKKALEEICTNQTQTRSDFPTLKFQKTLNLRFPHQKCTHLISLIKVRISWSWVAEASFPDRPLKSQLFTMKFTRLSLHQERLRSWERFQQTWHLISQL